MLIGKCQLSYGHKRQDRSFSIFAVNATLWNQLLAVIAYLRYPTKGTFESTPKKSLLGYPPVVYTTPPLQSWNVLTLCLSGKKSGHSILLAAQQTTNLFSCSFTLLFYISWLRVMHSNTYFLLLLISFLKVSRYATKHPRSWFLFYLNNFHT